MVLTIAAVVLLVINTLFWLGSRSEGEDHDISGFIPQMVRVLCCLAWFWWMCARAGRASALQLYELVALDVGVALVIGIGGVLAVIEAVRDARDRHWL